MGLSWKTRTEPGTLEHSVSLNRTLLKHMSKKSLSGSNTSKGSPAPKHEVLTPAAPQRPRDTAPRALPYPSVVLQLLLLGLHLLTESPEKATPRSLLPRRLAGTGDRGLCEWGGTASDRGVVSLLT